MVFEEDATKRICLCQNNIRHKIDAQSKPKNLFKPTSLETCDRDGLNFSSLKTTFLTSALVHLVLLFAGVYISHEINIFPPPTEDKIIIVCTQMYRHFQYLFRLESQKRTSIEFAMNIKWERQKICARGARQNFWLLIWSLLKK